MNCAESQDLLLDLAYGELPPARAAQVQEHVLGCASCRAEKEQLDHARRAAAPLRDLEEPPAGFDEPILRAARAEAGMQADGTPGPVVEVSASVKPLGLQAARLDPHARVRDGGGQPRPRWWRRAAVVGSIAAAAGLAVVVTSSVTFQAPHRDAREEVAPIQVRVPGAPVPAAVDHALSAAGERAAPPERKDVPTRRRISDEPPPAPLPAKKQADSPPAKAKLARRDAEGTAAKEEDRAVASAVEHLQKEAPSPAKAPASEPLALRSRAAAAPRAKADDENVGGTVASPPSQRQLVELSSNREAMPAPAAAVTGSPVPAAGVMAAGPANPDQLEDQASAARRRGEYVRAASLYRQASAQRRQSDPARAAWDMAHAVECLAAGGQVDEAVSARKELLRTFPDHAGPKAAADAALRTMRLPPDDDKAPAPVK